MSFEESPLAIVGKHQKEPPVILGPIARELSIGVVRLPLGKSIAGKIILDPKRGGASGFLIHLNSDDSINRQKFTLAHEISHFILHRDLIESGIVDDTMYRSKLENYYETQANQLAADILIPIRLVKKAMQTTSDPRELAKMFDVSEQAMKIRLFLKHQISSSRTISHPISRRDDFPPPCQHRAHRSMYSGRDLLPRLQHQELAFEPKPDMEVTHGIDGRDESGGWTRMRQACVTGLNRRAKLFLGISQPGRLLFTRSTAEGRR